MNDINTVYEILDPVNKKMRKVRDIRHATYDDAGALGTSEFVEFIVVGRNHEWPLAIPKHLFEQYNQDITVAPARKE